MNAKIITLLDADDNRPAVQEGESANVTGSFQNGDDAIAKAAILSVTFTLYDEATAAVINGRDGQDILDANGGSITAAGVLTLKLQPADNCVVGSIAAGRLEPHIGRVKWTWTDGLLTRTGIQEFRIYVEKLATPEEPE